MRKYTLNNPPKFKMLLSTDLSLRGSDLRRRDPGEEVAEAGHQRDFRGFACPQIRSTAFWYSPSPIMYKAFS